MRFAASALVCTGLALSMVSGCTTQDARGPATPNASYEPDAFLACGVDADEYTRLMSLSYADFDQDFFGGWRQVDYREGCSDIAASLIIDYIERVRGAEISDTQLRMLNWHAGQTTAYTDELAAVLWFERTFEDPGAATPSNWDLYVRGTLAFLRKDKPALQAAHDSLAARTVSLEVQNRRREFLKANPKVKMPEGFVTDPANLPALRSLLSCFEETYKVAYQSCPQRAE